MIVIKGGETEERKKRAYEKAMKVYKELKPSFFSFKKASDFSEAARKYSEDPDTASRGGRIDVDVYECRNAVEYMLLHGFHKKIFSLEPGDISDVFEFQGDYYIIQVRELEARKQAAFDEVREQVKQDIMDEKHQEVMENWEDNLLKSYGFAIYERNIEQWLEAQNRQGENS
jgi:foldase protein PrsA